MYTINKNIPSAEIPVYCDHTTDGGGWTVIQRRIDGSENFFRGWNEYKEGFGKLHKEHWLGNQKIHYLTAQAFFTGSEVRFDLLARGESKKRWVKYSSFSVDNEKAGFMIHVSGFDGGDAGDRFRYHDGMKFTTYDKDQDKMAGTNCAYYSFGAWWHNNCNAVNINGDFDRYRQQGDIQKVFEYFPYRLSFSEMKVRRK